MRVSPSCRLHVVARHAPAPPAPALLVRQDDDALGRPPHAARAVLGPRAVGPRVGQEGARQGRLARLDDGRLVRPRHVVALVAARPPVVHGQGQDGHAARAVLGRGPRDGPGRREPRREARRDPAAHGALRRLCVHRARGPVRRRRRLVRRRQEAVRLPAHVRLERGQRLQVPARPRRQRVVGPVPPPLVEQLGRHQEHHLPGMVRPVSLPLVDVAQRTS